MRTKNGEKALLLYNPRSGRGTIGKNIDMILQKFCHAGYEMTVYPTIEGMGAQEILDHHSVTGYDLVVCAGGDGTLHHTTNGLLRHADPPVLGYLPVGSTNDYASSLGAAEKLWQMQWM